MENGMQKTRNGLLPPSEKEREVKDKLSLVLELLWLHILILPAILLALYRRIFPPQEKSLKGQVALVTGAGRGLGRGLAVALAQEGCKVAVVDIDLESAETTAADIRSAGGQAKAYCTNVAKVQEIRSLRLAIAKDLGPVELLVNNAGIIYAEPIETCTEEVVSGVISVNLISHFWMAREFLPAMRERNSGHIVAIASASAFAPLANASAYVVSKFGVRGFMEVLRTELKSKPANNIVTTTVFPYFVNTSADYLQHWDLRIPAYTIDTVVAATISGIKKNCVTVTIPESLYFLLHLGWMLPRFISDKGAEILYTRVSLPTKEEVECLPQTSIMRDLAK